MSSYKSVFEDILKMDSHERVVELAKFYWNYPMSDLDIRENIEAAINGSFESEESVYDAVNYSDIADAIVYNSWYIIKHSCDLYFMDMIDKDDAYDLFDILLGNYPDKKTEDIFGQGDKSELWKFVDEYIEDNFKEN